MRNDKTSNKKGGFRGLTKGNKIKQLKKFIIIRNRIDVQNLMSKAKIKSGITGDTDIIKHVLTDYIAN